MSPTFRRILHITILILYELMDTKISIYFTVQFVLFCPKQDTESPKNFQCILPASCSDREKSLSRQTLVHTNATSCQASGDND